MRKFLISIVLAMMTTMTHADLVIGISDGNKGALYFEGQKFTGGLAGVFQCSVDGLGESYEFQSLPQARLLSALENGDLDLAMPLAQTPDRDQYAEFATTIIEAPFFVFSKTPIENVESVQGMTFVTLRSASYNEVIESRGGLINEVSGYEAAAKMVAAGRADATVIPGASLGPVEELVAGLERQVFTTQKAGIYVKGGDSTLLEKMNAAITNCK